MIKEFLKNGKEIIEENENFTKISKRRNKKKYY